MSSVCPTCGHRSRARAAATPRKSRKPRAIALAGRVPAEQRAWYNEAMRVKRGELVWSMLDNWDRFGARGGFVTPERAAELEAKVRAGAIPEPMPLRREVDVWKAA